MRRTKPSRSPTQAMVLGVCIVSKKGAVGLLPSVQDSQRHVVKPAVADDHVGAKYVFGAVPGAEPAARLLDQRLDGRQVPGVAALLHHQLAGTLRHQHKTVEVAEAALPLGSFDEAEEGFEAVRPDE